MNIGRQKRGNWSKEELEVGEKESHFGKVPNSIVVLIFQYLSTRQLASVSAVCRRFYKLAGDPSLLSNFLIFLMNFV
jgi:hypothetical protein